MAAVAENTMIASSEDQFLHYHRPSSTTSSTTSSVSSPSDNLNNNDKKSEFQRDVRELVDLLSKLNPSAKEFIPSRQFHLNQHFSSTADHFVVDDQNAFINTDGSPAIRRKKNSFNQGRRRFNGRSIRARREDSVRRTVYVSDIDQHVTEEHLAALFINCGQVVDCRVCGDPHSVLRFAFIEFSDEHGARAALSLAGTMLGYYPVRVLPSKTAILPVNPTFLPRSEDEREMCARTVYCTNIDKEVSRLRLLGDHVHSTRIAFVEFVMAESAIIALNCSGMILGTLPVRVSPSKTPVRPRSPRAMSQ
ncbi:hypothetical protein AQUCO_02200212v1 [Aquilegia coerulea]|uniref:RRM domain-containing protein n=1 Tax=Aquilegia coerulea TaxID=218851 RepID=A0A2G5DEF7_AQUCA|nr:hypothetical protein AQUCO_02200212v1 [Aquilegia coerulea]